MKNGDQVKESYANAQGSSHPRVRDPGGMRTLFPTLTGIYRTRQLYFGILIIFQ